MKKTPAAHPIASSAQIPQLPRRIVDYRTRQENDGILCIPLGLQDVYHDTIVPTSGDCPLLWINDNEARVLALADGQRSAEDIGEVLAAEAGITPQEAPSIVDRAIADFVAYKYLGSEGRNLERS